MSVSFDVYRVRQDGRRELVLTTQSAREAREERDASPDQMLVIGRDDTAMHQPQRERTDAELARAEDVEGDFLI